MRNQKTPVTTSTRLISYVLCAVQATLARSFQSNRFICWLLLLLGGILGEAPKPLTVLLGFLEGFDSQFLFGPVELVRAESAFGPALLDNFFRRGAVC